jgi:hypothetical protein
MPIRARHQPTGLDVSLPSFVKDLHVGGAPGPTIAWLAQEGSASAMGTSQCLPNEGY